MRLRMRSVGAVVLLLHLSLPAVTQQHPSPELAARVLQKLRSLTGSWQEEGKKNPAGTNFKSMVSDTVVMETLTMPEMGDMVTLYSVDGTGIALLHYCPTNNQPHMRAVPSSDDPKELVFEFQGAGNLPNLSIGHEQTLVMVFEDKNHITEQWTWRRQGKDTVSVFHFTRQ